MTDIGKPKRRIRIPEPQRTQPAQPERREPAPERKAPAEPARKEPVPA